MPQVYIDGKRVRINTNNSIGKGGEAEIFELSNGQALKLFKQPGHPDFLTTDESMAAEARLTEHQKKLPSFPKGLPRRVITPMSLARAGKGKNSPIVGYTMPFLKGADLLYDYSRKKFRAGISNQVVVDIFKDLHQTVRGTHRAHVVIGDFNDLNILVVSGKSAAYLIDADSFQFGAFQSRMFTQRFVDPILCEASELQLAQPHNEDSDWYAYNVMLMQSLLFVGPYGGIHRPKDKTKKVPHDARPLHRVTVFDTDVRYPKPAIPYKVLSDDVLHYFHQVFQKDVRGIFPLRLLEEMHWTTCKKCNLEHARNICPDCSTMVTGVVKQIVIIRGKVKATRIFETKGPILHAASQKGKLSWIHHGDDKYVRSAQGERDQNLLNGKLDPKIRYRVSGDRSFIAKTGVVIEMANSKRTGVDNFRTLPIFDTNSEKLFYLSGSQLLREDDIGSAYIGDVLQGQTLLWVGEKFGFGYYALGSVYNGFVFDTTKRGLTEVTLPKIPGQLIDSTCVFSKSLAWVFLSNQDRGKTYNHCVVIDKAGQIVGMTKASTDDPGKNVWLQQIRGKFAVGNQLYSPTDDGIVRAELVNGSFNLKEFPDTEPFVDSSCQLFPDSSGIYVVSTHEIVKLQIG